MMHKAIVDETDFGADVYIKFAIKRRCADELILKITEMGYGKDVPQKTEERFDFR